LLDTTHKGNTLRQVLILGGGEGATAREVLRWNDVDRVTMVDYDKDLVSLMRDKGESWSQGAFANPRLDVVYEDAWKYMESAGDYTNVIIDLTDPVVKKDIWMPLLTSVIKSVKSKQGGFVMNAGLYLPWKTDQLKLLKDMMDELCTVNSEFKYCMYTAMIPSFNGEWTFILVHHTRRCMVEPDHLNTIPTWIRGNIRRLDLSLLDEPITTSPTLSPIRSYI
jgi:spermidine synthase